MSNTIAKFHPILFATPMIKAIMNGTKTQTRRVIKLPNYHPSLIEKQKKVLTIKDWILYDGNNESIGKIKCHYEVGDVLWAKETFIPKYFKDGTPLYRADDNNIVDALRNIGEDIGEKWKPSIYMPKTICRIFLKVKSVRIERLMDIGEDDAKKEGVTLLPNGSYRNYHEEESEQNYMYTKEAKVSFATLWESINGKGTWEFNPYVFVYEYEKIEKPLDFI
jgi:hypothetical protein